MRMRGRSSLNPHQHPIILRRRVASVSRYSDTVSRRNGGIDTMAGSQLGSMMATSEQILPGLVVSDSKCK